MGSVLTTIAIGVAGAALGAGAVAVGRKLFGSGSRGSESTGATESYDEKSFYIIVSHVYNVCRSTEH